MLLETFTYDLATRAWSLPALPNLNSPNTMVLAFGSPEMVAHPKVFQILRDAYPDSSLVGCSSAGVIASADVRDRALSVMVAKFERTALRSAATLVREVSGSHAAGASLARKLANPALRAVLVLAEGLRVDGEALVSGIRAVIGPDVVVAGGLAGDDMRFERTWVCSGNRLQSGLIAGLGFYGPDLIVGCGAESGWERFGPERTVTRSEGHTLHELDGAPGADVYQRYLGARLAGLPAAGMLFPLALWPPDRPDELMVRPLLAADADTGALLFAGTVPVGHRARLMRTDADRLLHSAADAALVAAERAALAREPDSVPGRAGLGALAIAVSGVGRRMALGERVDEELKAVRRALPPGVATTGFYGYGEIAPDADGRCQLTRQSMTLMVLGEPGPGGRVGSEHSGAYSLDRPAPPSAPPPTPPPPGLELDDNEQTATASGMLTETPDSGFAEVTTFARDLDSGAWSITPLPALDSPTTLVLVFASSEARAHPRAFADLRLAYPRSHIIGCSAAGEVVGDRVRERFMSVAVVRFAHTELGGAQIAVGPSGDGESIGRALGRDLVRPDLRALLVFSSAPGVSSASLMAGLATKIDPSVPVIGSLAAGGTRGEHAWILARGTIVRQAVTAVALYGDHVIVGHSAGMGWRDIGPPRPITRAQGGVILALDQVPALACYQEALGASQGLPGPVPVALVDRAGRRAWRPVVGTDDRQRSVTIAGAAPAGAKIQLVGATPNRLVASAAQAAKRARDAAGTVGPNALGLMLGHTVRHMALGPRSQEEVAAVAGALGGVHLAGCYARGAVSSPERRTRPRDDGARPPADESAVAVLVLGESPVPRSGPPAIQPGMLPWFGDQAEITRTVARKAADREPEQPRRPRPQPEISHDRAVPVRAHPRGFTGTYPTASMIDAAPVGPSQLAIATFTYDTKHRRWSLPSLPALDSPQTMVMAFGASELEGMPEVFAELRDAYPQAHILGCSSAGEIADRRIRDHSLSVAVVRFAHTRLTTASVVVGDAAGSFAAGQVLAHKLDEVGLRAVFVLSEGLDVSGSQLLRGMQSVLDSAVLIGGGVAGDGVRFERTWTLSGDGAQSALVTAVGLYGDHLCLGQGAAGGWVGQGHVGTITRASGHVLFTIDERPALDWYREKLGPHGDELPATGLLYPLGLRLDEPGYGDDGYLVRSVLAINEGHRSLTFAGDMPEGTQVEVLGAISSQLITGAGDACRNAAKQIEIRSAPTLALMVSSVGRRVVLGDRADDELSAALEALPDDVASVGFYGYGGLAGFAGRAAELHNQTFLVTLISEAEQALTQPTAPAMPPGELTPLSGPASSTPLSTPAGAPRATPVDPTRLPQRVTPIPQHQPASGSHSERIMSGPELSAYRRDVHGVRVIELSGRLAEDFQVNVLAASLHGIVVLDLGHIERVTSFGVRAWFEMMRIASAQIDTMYLANCPEVFVNQLTLNLELAGDATVISFAAPYLCRNCAHTFATMLDCERDRELITSATLPEVACPQCDHAAFFDETPDSYFSFTDRHLGKPIPAQIRAALSTPPDPSDSGVGALEGADRTEKSIVDERTRVRIRGAIDTAIPWSHILDGIDGVLELDFADVQSATEAGLTRLDEALTAIADNAIECRLIDLPVVATEHLASHYRAPPAQIVSAHLAAFCDSCRSPRSARVSLPAHAALLRRGDFPHLLCKRCSSTLEFRGQRAQLLFVARAPARAGVSPQRWLRARGRWFAGAGAAAAASAALLWTVLDSRSGPGAGTGDAAPVAAARDGAASDPGAGIEPPPAVVQAANIAPPIWLEREFVIDADSVHIVGHSGPHADLSGALMGAYRDAVRTLLVHLIPALKGSPLYGYVRTRLDVLGAPIAPSPAGSSPQPTERTRPSALTAPTDAHVAARFESQLGVRAQLERIDTFSIAEPERAALAVRYQLSRADYDAVLEFYRSSDVQLGVTAVPTFPLLSPAHGGDGAVLVVAVEPRSPAGRGGFEVGDVIVRVGDTYVASLDEYRDTLARAWEATGRRQTLAIEVSQRGRSSVRQLRKRR